MLYRQLQQKCTVTRHEDHRTLERQKMNVANLDGIVRVYFCIESYMASYCVAGIIAGTARAYVRAYACVCMYVCIVCMCASSLTMGCRVLRLCMYVYVRETHTTSNYQYVLEPPPFTPRWLVLLCHQSVGVTYGSFCLSQKLPRCE